MSSTNCRPVAGDGALRPLQHFGRGGPLLLQGRHAPRIHRLRDQGDGNAQFGGTDHRPFPRAFLPRRIQDFIHQRLAVRVLEGQNVGGDFDEIGIQLRLVPIREGRLHFLRRHPQALLHQLVSLADQLHVPVFDAVVDHLHVMAGAVFPHPIAARRPVLHLGGDALENILDMRPGRLGAARHDGRAVPRPFFAPGNARADEEQPFSLQILRAPRRVLEQRIAAVNNNVALFQVGQQLLDQLVHRRAGLDHEHDARAGA